MENVFFVADYKVEGVSQYASINDVVEYISSLKVIGIDIETTRKYKRGEYNEDVYRGGLDPYLTKIVMLQLGDVNRQYVIDVRRFTKEDLAPILSILDYNKNIVLVGHNLRFESIHLKHNYGINFHTIYDTMLGELCLYNGVVNSLSLAGLSEKYLGVKQKQEKSLFGEKKSKIITLDDELLREIEEAITPFEVEDDFQLDKSIRMNFVYIGDKEFNSVQILYGADDIIFPILIRERQLIGRRLSDGTIHRPLTWMKIENHFCLFLSDMQLKGMLVDQDKWRKLHDENYIIFREREKNLNNFILSHYPEFSGGGYDLFSNEKICTIKWSSSKQVINLFKKLNICPRAYSKQTRRVEDTVGAVEILRKLPNKLKKLYESNKDTEIVDLDTLMLGYILYKKSEQSVTTFGKKWLKYIHPITGRAHSSYRQILNTTRISSTNPNLNNISGGKWRDCFIVPEGNVMVNLDYSNQEVRVASEVANEDFLMDFFITGDDFFQDDFHSFTATKVYRILEENPDLVVPPKEIVNDKGEVIKHADFNSDHAQRRTNAKTVTFGLLYGSTAYTFAANLGITIEEAEKLVDSYMDAFPGLKEHFLRCEKNAQEKDYVVINSFTGAMWFCPFFKEIEQIYKEAWAEFPEDYSELSYKDKISAKKILYEEKPWVKTLFQKAGRLRNSLANRNKNYPIQGSSAMMMKIAMNILRKEIIEQKLPIFPIGNIYDECLAETPKEYGEQAGDLIKYCMEKAGKIINPKVPHKANYVLSDVWEH